MGEECLNILQKYLLETQVSTKGFGTMDEHHWT